MNRTFIYIGAIAILLGANLFLFFSGNTVSSSDTPLVYLGNVKMSEVSGISFNSSDIEIEKEVDGWIMNKEYKADQGFINTLISVLERIESGRKIEDLTYEKLGDVKLSFQDGSEIRFQYASNLTRTKSYFIKDGKTNEVSVPGYQDNVVDMFLLHPDQWRDRLVFDGSWRSIQKLHLERSGSGPLEITFDDKFFLVNGNSPTDSSAVVDYLNQFQYFEANEMISKGRFPQFDSLALTDPLAILRIDDIKLDRTLEIRFFPNLKNQAYHLVMNENEMMVIDARRVQGLLASSQDFLR